MQNTAGAGKLVVSQIPQEACPCDAIFLDLDDTILDFRRAERQALSRTLEHFRVDPAPAVLDRYHELNRRQWELLEEGKLTRPQVLVRRFQLLFDELGVRADPEEVCQRYEEQLAQGHFFVPGARELLEALHTRYDAVSGHQRHPRGPEQPDRERRHRPLFPEHLHLRAAGGLQAQPGLLPGLLCGPSRTLIRRRP